MVRFTKKRSSTPISKVDEATDRPVEPLYTDCSIPAKLFFEIYKTKKYSLLGKGTDEQLEDVFNDIFEEYSELDKSSKVKKWYSKAKKIGVLEAIIMQITNMVYLLYTVDLTNEQEAAIESVLNNIPTVIVRFDRNKPREEEIYRINTKVLGSIRNRLRELNEVQEENTEEVLFIFEQDVARISMALMLQISSDISLYEYITYRETAVQTSKKE